MRQGARDAGQGWAKNIPAYGVLTTLRETPKAQAAWNDYLAMGPGRSFEKLLATYRACPEHAPTLHRTTLKNWAVAFGWQARLAEIAEVERQAIVAKGIAEKQNRIDAYNDRWRRMQQVIAERAEDIELQDVAGGKTGLIVHNVKGVGKGEDFQLIDLYEVDTGLLKELREHEKQAAQELGQWTEKKDLTTNGQPLRFTISIDRKEDDDSDSAETA